MALREWVIEMVAVPFDTIVPAAIRSEDDEGFEPDIYPFYPFTTRPQTFAHALSRIQWDVPPMATFRLRNVYTGEIIPGEVFAL